MKTMLASIGLLAAAVALGVGLGPWYTSRVADRQIAATVRALNRPGVLQARYQRTAYDWFGQQGTLTLVRLGQVRDNTPREVVLRLSVAYGPIAFAAWHRDGVSLMPVGAVIDTRIQGLGNALRKAGSGYRLRDVVALNGDNTLGFGLKPGHFTSPDGVHMQWTASALRFRQKNAGPLSGAAYTGTVTLTGPTPRSMHIRIAPARLVVDRLRYLDAQTAGRLSLTWNGLTADAPNSRSDTPMAVNIGRLEFAMDTHFVQGIVAGKAELRLAGMSLREPIGAARPLIAMRNMVLSSSTTKPQAEFMDSTLRWTVADVEVQGRHYARGVLDLRLEHQYVPALTETIQALQAANHAMPTPPGTPPAWVFQRMVGLLMPSLQSLIEHRPVLRLAQLRLDTPSGTLRGQGTVRIASVPGRKPSLTKLPQELAASLALAVPVRLAEHLAAVVLARQGVPRDQLASASQQYLDALQGRGLLRRRGNDYALRVRYRDRTLRVNGQTLWQG